MEKSEIIDALRTAHAELELAMDGLARLPSFDLNRVRFAAHTLNNYLTVTAATVALLQSHLAKNPDLDVDIWLNGLKHATALMTHTSLELLNAAPAGGGDLKPEKVDLVTLVRRACDFYGPAAERKAMVIHFDAEVESPFVWVDRVAIAAILDNLLSNAIKFSPPGSNVWVHISSGDGSLVCVVKDEGPGITPADRARLFERGVRLSNIPTGGEPSTGFGLAVAKDLVDKIGGTIECTSGPGRGAAFTVRLPAYAEH